jgi:prefoldin subunit 5
MQKNLEIKVEILQKSVEEYENDRREIINMIKSKDLKIAQLNAEIEALKNISNATVIYVKPSPI